MSSYVLIMETDAALASLYSQIVAKDGLEPVIVQDSDHAKTVLGERGPPSLMLMDLNAVALKDLRTVIGISGTVLEMEPLLSSLECGVMLVRGERVVYANKVLADMVGIPSGHIFGMTRSEFTRGNAKLFEDPEAYLRKVGVFEGGPQAAQEEFEMRHPVRRVIRWTARPIKLSGVLSHVEIYDDITARLDLEKFGQFALIDPVTGLFNRWGGDQMIARELARHRRYALRLSFAVIDVDHFKQVNDTCGHLVGDHVLRDVSSTVTSALRGADLAIRWGGDEFLVVLPSVGLQGATAVAERVRAAVADSRYEGIGKVTVSIGVAELQEGDTGLTVVGRADARLYEAKAAGRNVVRW